MATKDEKNVRVSGVKEIEMYYLFFTVLCVRIVLLYYLFMS